METRPIMHIHLKKAYLKLPYKQLRGRVNQRLSRRLVRSLKENFGEPEIQFVSQGLLYTRRIGTSSFLGLKCFPILVLEVILNISQY
jgi:hypothetical protein